MVRSKGREGEGNGGEVVEDGREQEREGGRRVGERAG